MPVVELLLGLVAFVAALIVLVGAGITLGSILLSEEPEAYLSDPAARRSLLRV